jgi:hypothetical protein
LAKILRFLERSLRDKFILQGIRAYYEATEIKEGQDKKSRPLGQNTAQGKPGISADNRLVTLAIVLESLKSN